MSDAVKVAGIITSGVVGGALVIVGELEGSKFLFDLGLAFVGVFGIFFPLPAFGKGAVTVVSKLIK